MTRAIWQGGEEGVRMLERQGKMSATREERTSEASTKGNRKIVEILITSSRHRREQIIPGAFLEKGREGRGINCMEKKGEEGKNRGPTGRRSWRGFSTS